MRRMLRSIILAVAGSAAYAQDPAPKADPNDPDLFSDDNSDF